MLILQGCMINAVCTITFYDIVIVTRPDHMVTLLLVYGSSWFTNIFFRFVLLDFEMICIIKYCGGTKRLNRWTKPYVQCIKPGIHDASFASKSPFKFLEFKFFDREYHARNLNKKTWTDLDGIEMHPIFLSIWMELGWRLTNQKTEYYFLRHRDCNPSRSHGHAIAGLWQFMIYKYFFQVRVTRSLVLCVMCCPCLFFGRFYFGHCAVYPSSIYGFWYSFGIFKLFFAFVYVMLLWYALHKIYCMYMF
jgi:hypothetical protein